MSSIAVRRLLSIEEMERCVALQIGVWNMIDGASAVPSHQLLVAAKYGGVVLGAFDEERMIGMHYSFSGQYQGQTMLCSVMTAVLPEYRSQGIGYALKVEQRRCALEQGYALVHWTFDPLELVNGNLNIRRLGGVARHYFENLYGDMRDGLNNGLPSDRLLIEWEIRSERVTQALAQGGAVAPAREVCMQYDGAHLPADGRPLAFTLPRRFQELKRSEPAAALQWRLACRKALQRAFAAGYQVTGADADGYTLTKDER